PSLDDKDKMPPPTIEQFIWDPVRTVLNTFGLYHEYPAMLSHNPDDSTSLADLSDIGPPSIGTLPLPELSRLTPIPLPEGSLSYAPFHNSTIFGLINWMWTGSAMKSIGEMVKLIDFLKSEDFLKEDLKGFDICTETVRLDDVLEANAEDSPVAHDGWQEVEVNIQVPDGLRRDVSDNIPTFAVPGLHLHKLTEVLKSAVHDGSASCFHYMPFKHFWKPNTDQEPERVYDELFSADAFINEHIKLQQQPPEQGCSLERVIAGLMFWSDSTHLASFGNASLWPLYLNFRNQSKWLRGKPSTGACHHVAYIPKLQLDGDFIHANEHGIIIECPDGVSWRFYPRIFTYSADYPEKVLLATIRNLGGCPCPRCLIPKERIPEMGTKPDATRCLSLIHICTSQFREKVSIARNAIYHLAAKVKSVVVERLMGPESLNAFSSLSQFGFNLFSMPVPDFMHDFCMVPTFGRSTIRQFSDNVSAMKKLAAQNYEDLLQCAIPVFEGLVDELHNTHILNLLFTLAEWHCLAKLRLHTESTLTFLDNCTTDLGRSLRKFSNTVCSAFDTQELPREVATPGRRKAKKKPAPLSDQVATGAPVKSHPKKKTFNMFTYKLHSLGDYVQTIQQFGTSDSYSTQPNFLPKLKDHLLAHLYHPEWTGDGNEFTPDEHFKLLI
ncbi:hypothetical protein H0H81_002919, partial [Sphagnurus paluster]